MPASNPRGQTRQEILRYLWSRDNPVVTIRELAGVFDMDEQSIRYHLVRLRAAGHAVCERGGYRNHLCIERESDRWKLTDAGMAAADELTGSTA